MKVWGVREGGLGWVYRAGTGSKPGDTWATESAREVGKTGRMVPAHGKPIENAEKRGC